MTKAERIKDIVNDCQNRLAMREWDQGRLGKRDEVDGDDTDSVMLDRWGRDGIVHDTSGYRGIQGVGTHPTPYTPSTQAPHIDNQHIDKSLKDFNDIAQRQAASTMRIPCTLCHGTGRMSISIVNGMVMDGGQGTMQLAGTGQDIGNGLGGGKG